jgi:hypothetical protein
VVTQLAAAYRYPGVGGAGSAPVIVEPGILAWAEFIGTGTTAAIAIALRTLRFFTERA